MHLYIDKPQVYGIKSNTTDVSDGRRCYAAAGFHGRCCLLGGIVRPGRASMSIFFFFSWKWGSQKEKKWRDSSTNPLWMEIEPECRRPI